MKKLLALLLVLLLLCSCAGAAFAEAEIAAEVPTLADQVEAQAFSLAMSCWLSYWENDDEITELFLWDAAGWYAARLYRTEGSDLVSPEQITAFLESLGWNGVFRIPETWEQYGVVRRLSASDGSQNLDFVQHKLEIDEMLGVNTMVQVTTLDEDTVEVVLTYYMNSEESTSWTYEFDFQPWEGGALPYRLVGMRYRDTGPELDPELGFTWEQLLEANSLKKVLESCPSVHVVEGEGEDTADTWLFMRGEDPALMIGVEENLWGQYRGCDFEIAGGEGASGRPLVTEFDESAGSWESLNGYISSHLSGVCRMSLDRDEGNQLWVDCVYRSGYHQTAVFDKATLRLQEIRFVFDDGSESGPTRFIYTDTAPAFAFLDDWDGTLRLLTLVWEDYADGQSLVRTEFVRTPATWEYLPNEARWGEYTVYLNKGYTKPYEYPGDGVDYTLFLTTAKG